MRGLLEGCGEEIKSEEVAKESVTEHSFPVLKDSHVLCSVVFGLIALGNCSL